MPSTELRQRAEEACARSAELRATATAAAETLTHRRAELQAVETRLERAQVAADPSVVAEAKGHAQHAYRRARQGADDERGAVAVWMREIDGLNRESRAARARLGQVRRDVTDAQQAADAAERIADAERIRAEMAIDACREARQQLAACEESDVAPAAAPTVPALVAADGPASLGDAPVERAPLVIERLVGGDRSVLHGVARQLADETGQEVTRVMLLLQELVEGLVASAADEGYLDFDEGHPFWGQFTLDEARVIVRALAGMGFRYHARDGWLGGRQPGPGELALALAYGGYDVRGVGGMPSASSIARLFDGARVATEDHLAVRAPSMTLDQVLSMLGGRADPLGELWDSWGRIRPLLLADPPSH
ncbi:MAG: hypothetical protein H0V04_06110 [Chloroflexi bacterium]|nr:hypothetical protein [Chloroflexota bacterium]